MTDDPTGNPTRNPTGDEPGRPVVALVPDLMDRSKVSAAAPGRVAFVPSATDLVATAVSVGAAIVIVDLARPGAIDAVEQLSSLDPLPTVVAFGSHVDREVLVAARRAGAARVLARSAFFSDLAAHLA
jgi:hypothetical protein